MRGTAGGRAAVPKDTYKQLPGDIPPAVLMGAERHGTRPGDRSVCLSGDAESQPDVATSDPDWPSSLSLFRR
ncbi:Hypothetical protein NTJ_02194 [Nesidiocoris tenuis]|uniref:Uncharacterized protein n=1 Tax=Nesidiocoris tenuis TaxID=355587 RepID=A0ABN7ADR2_9HEMI|nr:Hypothetical protein NTJ_02194 [Nesidiocoris tenuis]